MTTPSILRRLAIAPAVLALGAATLAPPAAGAALQRTQNTIDDFSCAFATEEGAFVAIFGSSSSEGSGSGAFVEGEGVYLEGWEGTAVFGPGTLQASVDLVDPQTGEPAGTVSVSATTALGDATVEEVDDRGFGNTWTRGTSTVADYTYSDVVITIDGFTPILADTTCSGQRTIFDVRSNDPASRVYRDSGSLDSAPCQIEGMQDAELRLGGDRRQPYLEIVIGAEGSDPRKAEGVLTRDGQEWVASLPLVALFSGEVVDTLDVTATFDMGAPYRERTSEGGFTEMRWVLPYLVTYEIVTDAGLRLTAQCEAVQGRSHTTISPQFAGE